MLMTFWAVLHLEYSGSWKAVEQYCLTKLAVLTGHSCHMLCFFCFVPHISISIIHVGLKELTAGMSNLSNSPCSTNLPFASLCHCQRLSSMGFYCGRRKNACQQLLPKRLNWAPEYGNAVQREKTGIRFPGHLTTEGYADLQVACEVLSLYPLVSKTCFLISAQMLLHWTRENNFVCGMTSSCIKECKMSFHTCLEASTDLWYFLCLYKGGHQFNNRSLQGCSESPRRLSVSSTSVKFTISDSGSKSDSR